MNSLEKNNNRLWFLTGNLGTGKSTVFKMLSEGNTIHGYHADQIAKAIMRREKIEPDNSIFENQPKKKVIENLIHPKVWEEIEKNMDKHHNKIFIVESALVFEVGWDKNSPDNIIVTTCDPQVRDNRLIKERSYTQDYINAILKHQLSQSFKEKKARVIIDTNCSKKELWGKADKVRIYLNNPNTEKRLIL